MKLPISAHFLSFILTRVWTKFSDVGHPDMSSENTAQHIFVSISDIFSENYSHEVNSSLSVSEQDSINSVINNEQCENNKTLSWHEHVYKKLNNKPTPHFIENILGIQRKSNYSSNSEETFNSKMPVISASLATNSFQRLSSVNELNEPLNLSIRSDKVRPKSSIKGG